MADKLRFAPLIRVSTEDQEEKGESLNTQKEQIQECVKVLNGFIPDNCWIYTGQEHATPEHNRHLFDKLLADSGKDLFDAVIVRDLSRWSRDVVSSRMGFDILKENGIKFFEGTTERDLFDLNDEVMRDITATFNHFTVASNVKNSTLSRIKRAKKGYPTGGKLPYGRTFDKKTGKWGINEEEAQKIRWAAEQYLAGKSIEWLGENLGMNFSNLWKILTKRSEKEWEIKFNSKRFRINETVTIEVPELLPQEVIDAIKEKAAANKTFTHGKLKNDYLLSRMIFCAECGYAMFGQKNRSKKRYYRHARNRKKECRTSSLYVPAHDIETAVLINLFSIYGDEAAMEKAIKKAIPDMAELNKLREHRTELEANKSKAQREIGRIVDSIAKGIINDDDAQNAMTKVRARITNCDNEIAAINLRLSGSPSEEGIRREVGIVAKKVRKHVIERSFKSYKQFLKMSYDDKRLLVEKVFAGKDSNGRRLGVDVKKNRKATSYTIRGKLVDGIFGHVPMPVEEAIDILNVPTYRELAPEDFVPPMEMASYKALMAEKGDEPIEDAELIRAALDRINPGQPQLITKNSKETAKGLTSCFRCYREQGLP